MEWEGDFEPLLIKTCLLNRLLQRWPPGVGEERLLGLLPRFLEQAAIWSCWARWNAPWADSGGYQRPHSWSPGSLPREPVVQQAGVRAAGSWVCRQMESVTCHPRSFCHTHWSLPVLPLACCCFLRLSVPCLNYMLSWNTGYCGGIGWFSTGSPLILSPAWTTARRAVWACSLPIRV